MPLSDYYPELAGWTPVEPTVPAAPQIPNAQTEVSSYLRATLPLPLQYAPDTLKQYNRPGLSTFRIAPIPPSGSPTINSSSAGISATTASSVSINPNTGILTINSPTGSPARPITAIAAQNLNQLPDGPSRFGQTASGLSYRPLTNPLTAHDTGANVVVTVAAFTMRTSSKGDISILGGTVVSLLYQTLYFIYYDDLNLAGGSVTFHVTTTKETALQGNGRFYVGSIFTPVQGFPDTVGNNDGGTGAQSGGLLLVYPNSIGTNTPQGNGAVANPDAMGDANNSTFAAITVTGNGSNNGINLSASFPSSPIQKYNEYVLMVVWSVPTNSLSSGSAVALSLNGFPFPIFSPNPRILATVAAGVTMPITLTSFPLIGRFGQIMDPSQITVNFVVDTVAATGSLEVDVYSAWFQTQN